MGIQAGLDTTESATVPLRVIEDKQTVFLAQKSECLFYVSLMSDKVPLQAKYTRRVEPVPECLRGVRNADKDWHEKLGI